MKNPTIELMLTGTTYTAKTMTTMILTKVTQTMSEIRKPDNDGKKAFDDLSTYIDKLILNNAQFCYAQGAKNTLDGKIALIDISPYLPDESKSINATDTEIDEILKALFPNATIHRF